MKHISWICVCTMTYTCILEFVKRLCIFEDTISHKATFKRICKFWMVLLFFFIWAHFCDSYNRFLFCLVKKSPFSKYIRYHILRFFCFFFLRNTLHYFVKNFSPTSTSVPSLFLKDLLLSVPHDTVEQFFLLLVRVRRRTHLSISRNWFWE